MSDQCKFCSIMGNIDKCLASECSQHDNWISEQHKIRYTALQAENEKLKSDISDMILKAAQRQKPAYDEQQDKIAFMQEREQELLKHIEFLTCKNHE